tara:strand:+ start:1156 stop:1410 length:255 start_codon:yes stop_codon:yes gene_type:complete
MPSPSPQRIDVTKLLNAMHAMLPQLKHGVRYTLQELVGEKYWYALSTRERKSLGHQFRTLVDQGNQPVRWTGRRSDNCQLYELK